MKSSVRLMLTRQCRLLAIIIVFVCVSCPAVAQDTIVPDKAGARRLCVTDTWAVWQTSKLIASTRMHRAASYVHRFYRQRLTEPKAYLVYTKKDTRVGTRATVTKNGTVALVARSHLSWHRLKGPSVTDPTYTINMLALYPDGIIRYESTKTSTQPRVGYKTVFFVPFKNDRLDMTSKIKLFAVRDRSYHGTGVCPPVVRHGRLLAWILMDVREGQVTSPIATWDATLHVHDMDSGKQRAVRLSIPLHKSYGATAFDGDVVKAYNYVFDARTGQNLFAVRNRIGYYISNRSLFATDLRSKKSPSIKLASVPRDKDCVQTASGIRIRNGKEWKTIPWLTEWPKPDR